MTRWLVFPGGSGAWRWLALDGATVLARGDDLAAIPRDDVEERAVIAIVSGTAVTIHWVDLPALAPAQALAAAQMLAADVCGGTIADTHVALGDVGSDGARPMVLVEAAVMRGWLEALAGAGLVVERIVPLPLLLPAPAAETDPAVVLDAGDIVHVRGRRLAFSAEPALAALMLANSTALPLDAATFETGLGDAVAAAAIDLRQGEFAARRQSPVDRHQVRRIALTALATAALWVATQGAALLRDNLAADRIEREAADAARAVLPRGTAIDAPRAQVVAHADRLGAGGQGFTALAAPLLTVLRDRAAMTLQSLRYAPDTGLEVVVVVPTPEDRAALTSGLGSAGLAPSVGEPRDESGTTVADVTVRPK